MYDNAYKKRNADEELGTQGFSANVRTGSLLDRRFAPAQDVRWGSPLPLLPLLYNLSHRLFAGAKATPHASAGRFRMVVTDEPRTVKISSVNRNDERNTPLILSLTYARESTPNPAADSNLTEHPLTSLQSTHTVKSRIKNSRFHRW